MVMDKNEFYSVKLKKKITIPTNNIENVNRGGRRFAVGTYKVDGKDCKAWKILGKKK